MPYLIDSDVLIEISRGNRAARQYLDALKDPWAISQIAALEIIVGARNQRELTIIDTFLAGYLIVPLRESTGKRAYELLKLYAKSNGLHVFDSLVAATAMEEGLTLVTRNHKHFEVIAGLKLDIPTY